MRPKTKKLAALIIAFVPLGKLRVALYRWIMGYDIDPSATIALGVQIAVDSFRCGRGVVIRRGTTFIGPIRVELGDGAFVGRYNKIECGDGAADASVSHMGYTRTFRMGPNTLVNESHLFDVFGTVSIGAGTWIAGFGSQFLTHGASAKNRDITMGEKCFLGSAVRFAPGSAIGNGVIVGMGAVVTKRIDADRVVVGGVPAKVIKVREPEDGYVFEKNW